MPTYTHPTNVPRTNATDADFRAWVGAVLAALDAPGGMVRTADAGQINAATVTRPTTVNAMQGYAVWRTDVAPFLYVKLNFGTGGTLGGANPSVVAEVGTGSDGAGNLTGRFVSGHRLFDLGAAAGPFSVLACTRPDGFVLSLWESTTDAGAAVIVVEPARNAAGAPTADGVWIATVFSATGSDAQPNRYYPATGLAPVQIGTLVGSIPALSNGTLAATAIGTNLGALPARPFYLGEANPSAFVLSVSAAELARGSTFVAPAYGTPRTWRVVTGGTRGNGANNSLYLAHVWE